MRRRVCRTRFRRRRYARWDSLHDQCLRGPILVKMTWEYSRSASEVRLAFEKIQVG